MLDSVTLGLVGGTHPQKRGYYDDRYDSVR